MATREYRIRMPRDTTVAAACEDVGCDQWRHGWETVCDLSDLTPVTGGLAVAMLIRSGQTRRTYTEFPGNPAVFRFESGQRCFREHRTRPARFEVREGGRLIVAHDRLADWGEDLAGHAGRLQDQLAKG